MNAWLPEGVRTGLLPVELRWRRPAPLPARYRSHYSLGPLVPRIVSITDGVNLVREERHAHRLC